MELSMNKKIFVMGVLIGLTLNSNEFTKKTTRKDKAQQETAYGDCVQLIDTLIEEACKLQQRLANLTGQLYKKLRLCALEEKPELARKETHELRNIEKALKALSKQLQELETAINTTEKLL
jgi:peptidoglycan hydrolase CwlO-like protein